ncbi:alanyl-tRNA editing protein [Aquibacillus halophilus]|uniref:Alanine--tRNA ligase n=1 Tax=Aquibacillus halophilus TaxID=930132 RepID=A0A6A8DHF0_9BACI|nr:DHHA1 domain-containing protein [Aquibacillus halophilus]MRH45103.1 alanyl-tRNA editing protein [Aquibacillus halophilus]
MTIKIFYKDPYIKSFTAKVIKQRQDHEGKWYVVLDKTAFYPTGGGQPHDIGSLNGSNVERVDDVEGEVRHYVQAPIDEIDNVKGEINWLIRFDHMQQHAGQHILSATFEELFGFKTVSFHLGKELCTIDLDIPELSLRDAEKAEGYANQIILENRPIEARWMNKEEVDQYELRKELSVEENIRLVIIPGFDYNGCGGTHPDTTGQVVAIKLLNWEKQRQRIRLEFVCGDRVRNQLGKKQSIINQLNQLLSSPEANLVTVVERLLKNEKEMGKSLQETREKLFNYEVTELTNNYEVINGTNVVGKVFDELSMKELQKIAKLVVGNKKDVVAILINTTKAKLQLVVARGSEVNLSMSELIKNSLLIIDGKGGGNEELAQGGGEPTITGEQFLQEIKEVMK